MNDGAAEIATDWRLECAGLCVSRADRTVLHHADFTLRPDESVAVIGPNGAGKTTLLLALLGLLPPAAGTVRLNGRDLRRLSARARGRFAAYVPQGLTQLPASRVYDVVAGGRFSWSRRLRRFSADDHAATRDAIVQCGLEALADRPLTALSGGERQKTLLAAAIAQQPRVLMLDEPNAALDPAYQVELVRALRAWRSAGRSLVVISHDLQLPAALGGRVVALRRGRIVGDEPADAILAPDTLVALYEAPFGTATTADGRRIILPDWWFGA